MQLDLLGVPRNVEVMTEFGIASFLLRGTRLITVIHERLARRIADLANLKLLKVPVDGLPPTTEMMVWTNRTEADAGHRWLRRRLQDLAVEITGGH
jgi:DNA-binding transcriptional LysR family regulator